MITGFYAALAGFAMVFMIVSIALRRTHFRVSLGENAPEALLRHVRAHGNFIETVPMALLLMLLLEISGTAFWLLHLLGLILIGSRVLHYLGLTTGKGYGPQRMAGMILICTVYVIAGVLLIMKFFGMLVVMQVLPL